MILNLLVKILVLVLSLYKNFYLYFQVNGLFAASDFKNL